MQEQGVVVASLAGVRTETRRARTQRHWPAVVAGLEALYPKQAADVATELSACITRFVDARPDHLLQRDLVREADPGWFQQPDMVGYVAYTDLFAGTLRGVGQHLDYLDELGVTYLHLMPLLRPRPGESDGGYAVADYCTVDPRLGDNDDLRALADALHDRGISLCVDVVLNHTAAEHDWARRARAGEAPFVDYYFLFPDRTLPDRYERTLREVFPDFAPGNFTWLPDAERWVWTTFHDYQWDLDWSNPDVFVAMFEVMLHLASLGVDVLRLDAVPFMWKRLGTSCENLPEVHVLLRTLRAAMAIAAPATIFKAEAIVPPDELTPYLGGPPPATRECELAYHNQLMVQLWSSLATGDARLLTNALSRVPAIPSHTTWVTYVRCHDDIGWAVTDDDARSVGWDGFSHRTFLNEFYTGEFPTSFAAGEVFQFNPATGDGRISGSAAALCGIERALDDGDALALDIAVRRLELLYAVIAGFGGIPLVYMGDELALRNDRRYLADPTRRGDNRWLHRPPMDWAAAARRHEPGALEERVFAAMRDLLACRRATPALHGSATTTVLSTGVAGVLAVERRHPERGRFAMLANIGRDVEQVHLRALRLDTLVERRAVGVRRAGPDLELDPMGYLWLTEPSR